MSIGPTTIFDKSALEALNVDEAALVGQFYLINLTPLFFIETLADLEKRVHEGRTPEQVVGSIACRTANMSAHPNAHHDHLVLTELLGVQNVPMDGRIPVAGGRPVRSGGRAGVVFEDAPEARALSRWEQHEFLEIERDMAREWRTSLVEESRHKMDMREMLQIVARPRTLGEVKTLAESIVQMRGQPFFTALDVLRIHPTARARIAPRWLECGAPPLAHFAPYASFVATVRLFFYLAVGLDMISADRPSNLADMAYLYYLPFCMVFTSGDKLHAKTVPLFKRPDQAFVQAQDLKVDLRRLDEYFSAQPKEVLDRGLIHFELPYDADYLTTQLWRRFLPGWKPGGDKVQMDSGAEGRLLEEFRAAGTAPEGHPVAPGSEDFVIVKHSLPVKMGKWQVVAEDVVARDRAGREKRDRQ